MRKPPQRTRVRHWLLAMLMVVMCSLAQAQDFEFVVIGDTRPSFESENFRRFESLIPRINEQHPAFVINVGDLIYGYGLLRKEQQWDRYQHVIRAIAAPYYQLPGNHDTYSKDARRIYGRRFGKFYESFDYGNCHFVLLDSTEEGRWGYIGRTQLKWLENDLKTTRAAQVFVFLHFPMWDLDRVTTPSHEFWLQTLHPMFRACRVKAVFGGHYHSYGPTREFDGIRYFITGGGGAELRPEYKKSGGDFHFMKVAVSGDDFDVRVLTERGEMSDTDADVMGGLQFGDRNSSRIGIRQGAADLREGVSFSVSLLNHERGFLSGKAQWEYDASAFSVEPANATFQVSPGATARVGFELKALKDSALLQSLPRLAFDVVEGGRRHKFHREVRFLREIASPYRSRGPKLDGSLEDWGEIPRLKLSQGGRTDSEIQTFYDSENLYLAVTIPTVKAPDEEDSPDELQVGLARRVSETDFGGDFLRLGFTRDATTGRNRTPGRKRDTNVPGVRSICHAGPQEMNYEIAVPLRLLKHMITRDQRRLVVNLSFRLPDPPSAAGEPAHPPQNSFYYSVRYGSDSLLPVHFIELDLQRRDRP